VKKLCNAEFGLDYRGVKARQVCFSRLAKADPVLGGGMAYTGEVGCLGYGIYEALLKAMLSVGYRIPRRNIMLSTGEMRSKVELLNPARMLVERGYKLFATRGTAQFLAQNGIEATVVAWPDEPVQPNVMDYIRNREFDLVINIPKNLSKIELNNDYEIRRGAIDYNIPLITNARLASAFIQAFCKYSQEEIKIVSWDEYR